MPDTRSGVAHRPRAGGAAQGSTRATTGRPTRRDHLIETALALFNAEGYRATGIDRILAESGVAKMTLYNHFKSKDELILAALRRRDERWLAWFRARVEAHAGAGGSCGPGAHLLAVFGALEDWFAGPDFSGCMFIKAASEFPGLEHPIHLTAARHQRDVLAYLKTLAEAAGAKRPSQLAREIMLLLEGAIVVTQVNGPLGAAKAAARVAEVLIAQAIDAEG